MNVLLLIHRLECLQSLAYHVVNGSMQLKETCVETRRSLHVMWLVQVGGGYQMVSVCRSQFAVHAFSFCSQSQCPIQVDHNGRPSVSQEAADYGKAASSPDFLVAGLPGLFYIPHKFSVLPTATFSADPHLMDSGNHFPRLFLWAFQDS